MNEVKSPPIGAVVVVEAMVVALMVVVVPPPVPVYIPVGSVSVKSLESEMLALNTTAPLSLIAGLPINSVIAPVKLGPVWPVAAIVVNVLTPPPVPV